MRLGFQEFRQLNDGIECTAVPTAHFTCNACLRHVVSNASAAIRCPVAHFVVCTEAMRHGQYERLVKLVARRLPVRSLDVELHGR